MDIKLSKYKIDKHIFISYAASDGLEIACKVKANLTGRGYSVWLDRENIKDGFDWDSEIDKGLRNSRALILVLTPGSVLSLQVKSEWNDAINRYIPVIPLLCKDCVIPRVLKMLNYIEYHQEDVGSLTRLLGILESLEDAHVDYLKQLLNGYIRAQSSSDFPENFQYKITSLQKIIDNWTKHPSLLEIEVNKQQIRIEEGVIEERKLLGNSINGKYIKKSVQIVGQRLMDIDLNFRNRDKQRQDLRESLENDNIRIISIVGRGGIGKTGLVSKVFSDIENTEKSTVDGIVYMSTRTKGINLEKIIFSIACVISQSNGNKIKDIWLDNKLDKHEKISMFLSQIQPQNLLLLLDNMEDLLDGEGELMDPDLDIFFEVCMQQKNSLNIVITAREPLAIFKRKEFLKFNLNQFLQDGLPEKDAIAMLYDLDPNDEFGIKSAPIKKLIKLVRLVHGLPRALEVIVSILANDPFIDFDDLLNNKNLYSNDQFVDELVRENYKRLDLESRRLMEALSVFNTPVPIVAVDFVIEPFLPGLDTKKILKHLINSHAITYDKVTKKVYLHPIDRDYIYNLLPDGL